MSQKYDRICANCKHWDWFEVDYDERPEDRCGSCKIVGEIMYGDDEACEDYCSSGKNMSFKSHKRNREFNPNKARKQRNSTEYFD